MKYRVRIDAVVNDTATRDKIKDGIMALQGKLQRINTFETSSIVVEECHHDESPPQPCIELYRWQKA